MTKSKYLQKSFKTSVLEMIRQLDPCSSSMYRSMDECMSNDVKAVWLTFMFFYLGLSILVCVVCSLISVTSVKAWVAVIVAGFFRYRYLFCFYFCQSHFDVVTWVGRGFLWVFCLSPQLNVWSFLTQSLTSFIGIH